VDTKHSDSCGQGQTYTCLHEGSLPLHAIDSGLLFYAFSYQDSTMQASVHRVDDAIEAAVTQDSCMISLRCTKEMRSRIDACIYEQVNPHMFKVFSKISKPEAVLVSSHHV
jgi:hypothetical protein